MGPSAARDAKRASSVTRERGWTVASHPYLPTTTAAITIRPSHDDHGHSKTARHTAKMVKVLENTLIDLDLMPGSSQLELKQMAHAQLDQDG